MTAFSNSSADATANAAAYTRSLLDMLGDRDPLEVMSATPGQIRTTLTGVPDPGLRKPERDGKWSMIQVVQHLADVEIVQGWRYRLVIAEDGSPIHGYDQEKWVARLWRGDEQIDDVLEQHAAVRKANLRLLRSLTAEEWERAGVHSERGRESARHMVRLTAGHDLVHLSQLRRIRDAVL